MTYDDMLRLSRKLRPAPLNRWQRIRRLLLRGRGNPEFFRSPMFRSIKEILRMWQKRVGTSPTLKVYYAVLSSRSW
jgi:hypothetical protein